MSRTKLLLDVVEDMRALADSLQAVATALAENELAEAPPKPVPTTMISSFLLLLGLTRRSSDLRLVHFSAKGPSGIFEINLSAIFQ